MVHTAEENILNFSVLQMLTHTATKIDKTEKKYKNIEF